MNVALDMDVIVDGNDDEARNDELVMYARALAKQLGLLIGVCDLRLYVLVDEE
jgi:hypothetical protein